MSFRSMMMYVYVLLTMASVTTAFADFSEEEMSSPKAVPFYTGTIYPVPQQATYQDVFLPLNETGVMLGKDIEPDDARLALLIERITRYGGDVRIIDTLDTPCDTVILLGDTGVCQELLMGKKVPQHPEGYLLWNGKRDQKHYAFLQGYDFHGVLWAITAFNQLITIEQGRVVARGAMVLDYPDAPGKRGYTAMRDDHEASRAWFAVNVLRANVVLYRQLRDTSNWRGPIQNETRFEAWQKQIQKIGAQLNPLKITWYDGLMPLSVKKPYDMIRSKSKEDFDIVVKAAMALAEAGGHLCLLYDDFRFPLHPDDVRDFGTARDADVYFLNKLYAAVSENHPDFRILFCPPFYWGPASDPSEGYGESREAYLAALGTHLPDAIDIYWTGPRVKSNVVTQEDIAWYTNLIQRKPVYWQNTAGVSHGSTYYVFPTDTLSAWRDWYSENFFDQLAFGTYNNADAFTTMTLFDAMWNHGAYDPGVSAETAGKKLVGVEAYPQLVEIFKQLERLDAYGWFKVNSRAAKNLDDVRYKTKQLVELLGAAPSTLKHDWLPLALYVSFKEQYLEKLINSPDLKALTEVEERVRQLAVKESQADPSKHLILTPNDFKINRSPTYYRAKNSDRRFAIWVYGQETPVGTMEAQFQLPYSLSGHSQLIIAGLDHNVDPSCRIRIEVNGNVVFEGYNPFVSDQWTTHCFEVKGAYLRDGVSNTLKISNIEESSNVSGAPWFMLNYAVLKPASPTN